MTDYFKKMFAYDVAVNAQMLTWLREAPDVDSDTDDDTYNRVRVIFAHLLAAEKVWLLRLCGKDAASQAIWPELSLEACGALLEENRKGYTRYLEDISETDLGGTVQYQNSQGKPFETSVEDILSHVLVHSGYHRGQVTRMLRDVGAEPLNTDYISYVRSL